MRQIILSVLTLMMAGRMMTLAFIHRAGRGLEGDPPAAWLMPLIGDTVIGVSALVVVWLIWRVRGLWVWTVVVVWNVVGAWDALSAYVVRATVPWPSFFMLEIFGSSLFFMAAALHVVMIWLVTQPKVRHHFLKAETT